MEVKITVDYKDAVQGLDENSSKRFMKAWAIAIKNLAKHNVQEKASESNGKSFWQREILPSIHEEVGDAYASIYSDSCVVCDHIVMIMLPDCSVAMFTEKQFLPLRRFVTEVIMISRSKFPA